MEPPESDWNHRNPIGIIEIWSELSEPDRYHWNPIETTRTAETRSVSSKPDRSYQNLIGTHSWWNGVGSEAGFPTRFPAYLVHIKSRKLPSWKFSDVSGPNFLRTFWLIVFRTSWVIFLTFWVKDFLNFLFRFFPNFLVRKPFAIFEKTILWTLGRKFLDRYKFYQYISIFRGANQCQQNKQ